MLHILQRKTFSLFRQSRFTQLWLSPVWLLLGFSKIAIFAIPFRRLVLYLGSAIGVEPLVPLLNPYQEMRAAQISRVVRLAAHYTPWDSNCFPQAVTARLLLGLYRIPYALYFGLIRDLDLGEFKAHAWVAAGRVQVTGGSSFGHYTVVGCFVAPKLLINP
jgi:hypothetical protein